MNPNPPTDSAIERARRALFDVHHPGAPYPNRNEQVLAALTREVQAVLSASYPQRDEGEMNRQTASWALSVSDAVQAELAAKARAVAAEACVAELEAALRGMVDAARRVVFPDQPLNAACALLNRLSNHPKATEG